MERKRRLPSCMTVLNYDLSVQWWVYGGLCLPYKRDLSEPKGKHPPHATNADSLLPFFFNKSQQVSLI